MNPNDLVADKFSITLLGGTAFLANERGNLFLQFMEDFNESSSTTTLEIIDCRSDYIN